MTRFHLWLGLAALLALLFLAACGPSTVEPAGQAPSATLTAVADQEAIEAAVQATLTAVAPKLTPTPTGPLAPDFTLPDLDGKMWSLSQFRERPVVLFFWATW